VQRSDVAEIARHHGFGAIADQLAQVAQWGMRIEGSGLEIPGRSRLGGRPDLEPSTPWPTGRPGTDLAGRPMTFLAQIDLGDVTGIDWGGPSNGLLSFFMLYDDEGDMVWGDAVAVLRQALPGAVARDHPEDGTGGDRPAPTDLTFKPELCLPSIASEPSDVLVSIGMDTDRDPARYYDLCHSLAEHQGLPSPRSGGPAIWQTDRFAGHPGFLQSDPIFDAADLAGSADPSHPPFRSGWRQLLQLTEFDDGEELGKYICAPTDADGWRLSEAQVVGQHS
jgi:hypothetical protein